MHNVYRYIYKHSTLLAVDYCLANSFYLRHLVSVYIRVLVQLTSWWPIYDFETSGQAVNKRKKCAVCDRKYRYTFWKQQTHVYQITNSKTQNGKQCHRTFRAQMICKLWIQEVLRTLKCKPVPLGLKSGNSGNEFKTGHECSTNTQQKPTPGVQARMCVTNRFEYFKDYVLFT